MKDNDNTVIWDVYNDVGDNTIDIFDDVYIRKYLCGLQENDYRKENDHENRRVVTMLVEVCFGVCTVTAKARRRKWNTR